MKSKEHTEVKAEASYDGFNFPKILTYYKKKKLVSCDDKTALIWEIGRDTIDYETRLKLKVINGIDVVFSGGVGVILRPKTALELKLPPILSSTPPRCEEHMLYFGVPKPTILDLTSKQDDPNVAQISLQENGNIVINGGSLEFTAVKIQDSSKI